MSAAEWRKRRRPLQGHDRGGLRPDLPAGSPGAALGRDRRRLRELEERPRGHLQAAPLHPFHGGNRRKPAGDGLRQSRREVRHRRRLHAQPLQRGAPALRRVPRQCPGRGRGRRHPHAPGTDRACPHRIRIRQAVAGEAHAGGLRPLRGDLLEARDPLQGHAGSRIHDRARQALAAADAARQAHRAGGTQDRRRHDRGGADQRARGRDAGRDGLARPAPAPDHRPGREPGAAGDRPAGLPRRRLRRDRLHLGGGGGTARGRGARSCSSGQRPARRTSTACVPPKASSPRAGA